MRLVIISDTHYYDRFPSLPDGDVLIHAGDHSFGGARQEIRMFLDWFSVQPHKHKIFIAGNHDFAWQKIPAKAAEILSGYPCLRYLQDSEHCIDGVKFYGSPWQPEFHDWAFNLPRGPALAAKWAMIPDDVQVLITHGPPFGILDTITPASMNLGCQDLRNRLHALPNLRVHAFGHIHGGYGHMESWDVVQFINASVCNEAYQPVNPPFTVDI